MTDSEFSFSRPAAAKSFRRSLSAHPTQSPDKDQVSFVSAVHLQGSENPVLQSMCKLLTSLLRFPVAGKPHISSRRPLAFPPHSTYVVSTEECQCLNSRRLSSYA